LSELASNFRPETSSRRWWFFAVVLASLFLMGFYTVTDPARLADSQLLAGADYAGYALCHRITDRSFTIAGRQFPLCARCTGMYLGIALSFLLVALAGRLRRATLPPLRVLLLLGAFIGLMGIDGLNSYSHFFPNAPHLYEPRNWLRLTTGMGTGLAMGLVLLPVLAQTFWQTPLWEAPVVSLREFMGVILLASALILLLLRNQATISFVLAIVSAAGVILILTALNAMLLLIFLRRDGRARRWSEVVRPLLLGLLFALLQLGTISALRFALTGTMTGFPGL
jgi:uncharacterized membrane protein